MSNLRANVVSRFLSSKGEQRSTYSASRVRGYGLVSSGFEAKGQEDGSVKIEFILGHHGTAETRQARHMAAMDRLERKLSERYTVERKEYSPTHEYLIVTPK